MQQPLCYAAITRFVCIMIVVALSIVSARVIDKENKEKDVNFAIIVDAGSSGSRMFVYTWSTKKLHGYGLPTLEIFKNVHGTQVVRKVLPGLSTFADNLPKVQSYISVLLDYAVTEIPKEEHESTPLYIMATAGMRLLSEQQQQSIWFELRKTIKNGYKFKFENQNAKTISGDEEALFGWIAINYLSERFAFDPDLRQRKSTHGMMDMGGASMQIAFELTPDQKTPDSSVTEFSLKTSNQAQNTEDYRIYLVSYLNFGVNVLRKRYEQLLLQLALKTDERLKTEPVITLNDPCLQPEMQLNETIVPREADDFTGPKDAEPKYEVSFTGIGNYDACEIHIKPLFNKQPNCKPLPCAIGNVSQPMIDFRKMAFYGLTEYFYALEGLFPGDTYDYTHVSTETKKLCAIPWSTFVQQMKNEHPGLTEEKFETVIAFKTLGCFKAASIIATLHVGLAFPYDYKLLHPITHMNEIEVQWSLGALLYMLNWQSDATSNGWPVYLIVIVTVGAMLFIGLVVAISLVLWFRRSRGRSEAPTLEETCLQDTTQNNSRVTFVFVPTPASKTKPANSDLTH